MKCCNKKCFLSTVCVLQLIAVIEWQVFQFLASQLALIVANFLHMILVTIGLVGVCRYHSRTLIVYAVWSLIWIGWNAFIICIYLEVGILKQILGIGRSWWDSNGIGCSGQNSTIPVIPSSTTAPGQSSDHSSDSASGTSSQQNSGCLVQFSHIEILHAGIQCLLAIFGFVAACYVIRVLLVEEDSSQPVHDELEYIKMRHRPPTVSSGSGFKNYENLTGTPSVGGGRQSTIDQYEPIEGSPPPITRIDYDTETLPILSSHPPQTIIGEDTSLNSVPGDHPHQMK